jgi:hypothetical protein
VARPLIALALVLSSASAVAQAPAPAVSAPSAPSAASAPTVRPDVAKPLQAAQDLIAAKDGKAALAKLAEAEAMPGLTPYESYIATRLKLSAAVAAGDNALALTSLERTLASELLPAADRLPLIDVAARLTLQARDWPRAATWLVRYKEAGGNDPQLLQLLPQVLAESGDHAGAAREGVALVHDNEAAKRPSPEGLLRTLAFSQNKVGDAAGYVATLELLARQHPKTEYWSQLISLAERKPGFNGERLRLDVYRLLRATGVALEPGELADMAQRAQQAGLPAEAQALLDEGYAAGKLGKGRDAAAQQKLREQTARAAAQDRATLADSEKSALAAKDGNALVNLGFALSAAGQHDKAVALIDQGFARGGLRRPDEAALHRGIVLWRAGRKEDAERAFTAVRGGEGTAELARVWALYAASAK